MRASRMSGGAKRLDRGKLPNSGRLPRLADDPVSEGPNAEWLVNSRLEAERDFDRILFATPTRPLGDKTQVFPLERNESVRTRLTHSHEVGNLARSIGTHIVTTRLASEFWPRPAKLLEKVAAVSSDALCSPYSPRLGLRTIQAIHPSVMKERGRSGTGSFAMIMKCSRYRNARPQNRARMAELALSAISKG